MDGEKTLSDVKSEHLATLYHECTIRAKEISERSAVIIPDEITSFVTETSFRFCQMLATDIESFARHAKRSTINMDDVLLFARRNPLLNKSAEFDAAADVEDANSDVQPVKRKKQPTKNKLKVGFSLDGSASKFKDSPLKPSSLMTFFIQPASSNLSISDGDKATPRTSATAMDTSPFQSPVKNASNDRLSTPQKGDTGEGATRSAFETSLFDDKDDFSNIFDDFDP
ncbi:unnamed protein product [Hymenolepis diminuta]|uniref:Centromere protein S n=1 Tax=Hymenolepis diminuta TaxID=6216 RepID=A0A0R3SWV1_HYMDI|nr:unnamed protein product [Hymenolepis diminuta]